MALSLKLRTSQGDDSDPGQAIVESSSAAANSTTELWTVPDGVYILNICLIGQGGCTGSYSGGISAGGSGGLLQYANDILVYPGLELTVKFNRTVTTSVGETKLWIYDDPAVDDPEYTAWNGRVAGNSTFQNSNPVGVGGVTRKGGAAENPGAGGSAGGYSGNGSGAGVPTGNGGSGSGGFSFGLIRTNAGGTGIKGEGADGADYGEPGSGGSGQDYGGGASAHKFAGSGVGDGTVYEGGLGAVRFMWGAGRAYPSTNTADV